MAELQWPEPPLADAVVALRPWRPDDVPARLAAFADPTIRRFSDWGPDDLLVQEQRRVGGEQIDFALVDAQDVLLGGASLYGFVNGRAGIGYWLVPEARGHGVATHTVGLLARWAFEALGVERIEITCGPDNHASQRVAARCGFTREGVLRSHVPFKDGRRDTVMFSLLPTD